MVQTRVFETEENVGQPVVIPRSEWIDHKGRSYFIAELPRYDREEYGWGEVCCELLDGTGEVLVREENVKGWSSGLG